MAKREALIAKQLSERKILQVQVQKFRIKYQNKRTELLKGMHRHYRKTGRQDEIRKLYEQEKHKMQPRKGIKARILSRKSII